MAAQYIGDETITDTNTDSELIDWPGGPGVILAQGTWDGANLRLKFNVPTGDTNWFPVQDIQGNSIIMTADAMANFEMCPCRIQLRGGGLGDLTSVKIRIAPSWQGWFKDLV